MKKIEKRSSSRLPTIRELVSAVMSQPALAYPLYAFLVVGTSAVSYQMYQQQFEKKKEQVTNEVQKVLLEPEPSVGTINSETNPVTTESASTAPVVSEKPSVPGQSEEIDMDAEYLELLKTNMSEALESDHKELLRIEQLFKTNEQKNAIMHLGSLSSRLRMLVYFLDRSPLDLRQKEKALRNLALLKSLLETFSREIPVLNKEHIRGNVVDFLESYVQTGVIFRDQAEADYASHLAVSEGELRGAFQSAIAKASHQDSRNLPMEDLSTIIRYFNNYSPSLQAEALRLMRGYMENADIDGTRRVQVYDSYLRLVDQTYSDEEQRAALKSGLSDISYYHRETHLRETLLFLHKPDQEALDGLIQDLAILKQHLPRAEYLAILEFVHKDIKLEMYLLSHRKPSEGSTLRDDWIGFDNFLQRVLKPLFMEAGSLPDENPDFNSRMPETN